MEHSRIVSLEATTAEQAARRNYYEEEADASFWKRAAASLPPHVQRKYAHLFDAAERYEPFLEIIVDRCSDASRSIGRLFGSRPPHRHAARSEKAWGQPW